MDQYDDGVRVLEERMIENPLTTEGLVHDALEAGKEQPRWAPALINRVTMFGGLARMKGLSEAQLAAAHQYRVLTEVSAIEAGGAMDYEAVRVDVSFGGRDVVLDGAAARKQLMIARRTIGPFFASLLDKVVCEEMSVRDVAQAAGKGGGNGQQLTSKRIRLALDALVGHFGRGRRGVRSAGDVAGDWSTDGGAEPSKAH